MNAAVDYQLVERKACDLAANRIERAYHDGVRRIVHNYFHACGSFQRTDVAAFAAYDATLHLVVVDGEGSDGILYGCFGGGTLYSVDYYALGLPGGIQAGFVHGVVDVCLRLRAGLSLEIINKHVLGFLCGHSCYGLELAVNLCGEPVAFFLLAFESFLLGVHLAFRTVQFVLLAAQFGRLLAKLRLLLVDCILPVLELLVLGVDVVFVLAFELDELLLRLQDLLLLYAFCLEFSLLEYAVPPAL